MTVQTEARNATLADLATILKSQQAAKIDAVIPATAMRSKGALIHVEGTEPVLTEDGVTQTTGVFRPTAVFDETVAEKLAIPVKYVRRMREERPDLYDANVNGWLHGKSVQRAAGVDVIAQADPRSFLFRGFSGADGDEGVARALLSDSYGITDNLDVVTAVLNGVRESGVEVEIKRCDLTERRMYVEIAAPSVAALAPDLLDNYRSPNGGWTVESARAAAAREGQGYPEGKEPVVFAGFVVSNSETGDGAFSITPRLIVKMCANGLTMTADAMRSIHLGGKMEQGVVRWSEDTQRKNLAVVTAKARDAVATFLDVEYVRRSIRKLEEKAGVPVKDAAKTIELVGKRLTFSEAQINGVLDHFIAGGQLTAGGVMQAITSFSQTIDNADVAYDLDAKAVQAMELVAALH